VIRRRIHYSERMMTARLAEEGLGSLGETVCR
jgi:hypothetical protein